MFFYPTLNFSSYPANQHLFLAHNYQLDKIEPSTSKENPTILVKSEPKSESKQLPKEVKKKASKKPSRGRYVQYSDEIRAKIGKFALKHGNSAAMKHFYSELGHEIPESTIRGMRDKYQLMSERGGAWPGSIAQARRADHRQRGGLGLAITAICVPFMVPALRSGEGAGITMLSYSAWSR